MMTSLLTALCLAAAPVELFTDRQETYVRAGTAEGLKVGSVVLVLGDPIANTDARRRVGKATVLEVWEHLARVKLDEAAAKAPDAKFVELEKPAAGGAGAAAGGGLKGRATLSGGVLKFRKLTIYNDGARDWTNCDARLPDNRRYKLARLKARDQEAVGLLHFEQDGPEKDVPLDHLVVKCAEGQGKFAFPK